MTDEEAQKLGPALTTRNVYVGTERYQKLYIKAINVSYQCKHQITASQVIHYLIDNCLDDVVAEKVIAHLQQSKTPN